MSKLSKSQIKYLKNDTGYLYQFFLNSGDREKILLLKKLGRIDNSLREPLLSLLDTDNDKLRYWVVKNLAKLKDIRMLDNFVRLAFHDSSSLVRYEAVLAIDKLRNESSIPHLMDMLCDKDPNIVLHAMKALLSFSNKKEVKEKLQGMKSHKEGMLKDFINKKFNKNIKVKKHIDSPQELKNVLVLGDVLDVLKYVPEESVHLTFTSPPYYNARDYSIYSSYADYLVFLENVFYEIFRVTKEGRFFIINTSPIIIPRVSRECSSRRYPIPYDIHPILVKMGWEFIDDIVWVKPESSCKNRNGGFYQHRKPLAYKPNIITEMIMVYRKKSDKLLDWNIKQYDKKIIEESKVKDGYETTNVWEISPTRDSVHSAVFPIKLCDRVIKYYSFKEDLVFDPFAGSGTFGLSALNLNRKCFLIEKEEKYFERIKTKLLNHSFKYLELNEFTQIMEQVK